MRRTYLRTPGGHKGRNSAFTLIACRVLYCNHFLNSNRWNNIWSIPSLLTVFVNLSIMTCCDLFMFCYSVADGRAHLGYCGIAAGCGCCIAAHASHTRAVSSPNSAKENKGTPVRIKAGLPSPCRQQKRTGTLFQNCFPPAGCAMWTVFLLCWLISWARTHCDVIFIPRH